MNSDCGRSLGKEQKSQQRGQLGQKKRVPIKDVYSWIKWISLEHWQHVQENAFVDPEYA